MVPAVTTTAGVGIDRGVALLDGAGRIANLLGAPAGGVLIGVLGPANVVALDAVSLAVAAVLLLSLVPRSAGATTERTGDEPDGGLDVDTAGHLTQLGEGFRCVARQRLLRSIAEMVAFTNFADAAMSGLLLLLWAPTPLRGHQPARGGRRRLRSGRGRRNRADRRPRRPPAAAVDLRGQLRRRRGPALVVLALPSPLWAVLAV